MVVVGEGVTAGEADAVLWEDGVIPVLAGIVEALEWGG